MYIVLFWPNFSLGVLNLLVLLWRFLLYHTQTHQYKLLVCLFVFFVLIKNMEKNLGSLFSQETPSILEPMEANLEKPRTMCPGFSVASLKSLGSVWLQTFEGEMIMYLFTSFYYSAESSWKPTLRFNLIKYNYNFRKWVIIETSSLNLFSLCGLRDLQV